MKPPLQQPLSLFLLFGRTSVIILISQTSWVMDTVSRAHRGKHSHTFFLGFVIKSSWWKLHAAPAVFVQKELMRTLVIIKLHAEKTIYHFAPLFLFLCCLLGPKRMTPVQHSCWFMSSKWSSLTRRYKFSSAIIIFSLTETCNTLEKLVSCF